MYIFTFENLKFYKCVFTNFNFAIFNIVMLSISRILNFKFFKNKLSKFENFVMYDL